MKFNFFVVIMFFILNYISSCTINNNPQRPLNKTDENWKHKIEKLYQIKIDYCGLDEFWMQDTVFYIDIKYKIGSNFEKEVLNNIEGITEGISKSYIKLTNHKNLMYIKFSYFNGIENNIQKQIETNQPEKFRCIYSIKRNKVESQVNRLITPRFAYGFIHPRTPYSGLSKSYIGSYLSKSGDYIDLFKERGFELINNANFLGLEGCTEYETKIPQQINLKNAYIECFENYVFYNDQNISITLRYECKPLNINFKYKDLVKFLTIEKKKKFINENYYIKIAKEYLDENYLNYRKELYNVLVTTKTDTSKIPWTIRYQTSLNKLKYYKDIDYCFEDI